MTSEQDKPIPEWAMRAAMVVKGFAPTMEIDRYFSPKTCEEVRRCARIIAALAPLNEAVKALEEYGEHTKKCILSFFDAYDPARGYCYAGEWMKEPPPCSCGLNAILAKLKGTP